MLENIGVIILMELKAGFVCDRGLNPKRPVNQDRFLAIPERGLFAVFDGVGGQRAGEVASQTAADTIEEALTHTQADSSKELIRRAIQFANRDIFEMAESDPTYKTMATTVALVHIDGDRATIAHVGDSRVYRLAGGRLYRETIDHTDLNDDIRAGLVSKQKAVEQEDRNVINRALGIEPDVEVEIKTVSVSDGTRLLLCSDGIYRHLSDEQIARLLAENEDPQRAAEEFKRIVYERGADDNLTAIVVQLGRARQPKTVAVDSSHAAFMGSSASRRASAKPAGGRIHVNFGPDRDKATGKAAKTEDRTQSGYAERAPGYGAAAGGSLRTASEPGGKGSFTRKLVYVLLATVIAAGAFYAGLRASDYLNGQTSERDANGNALMDGEQPDPLRTGREAFLKGDYQKAMTEFDSILMSDPENATARYWLGRAQLEQRDYQKAAQNFEQVITTRPQMYDAYIQAAAAYEAGGEKIKSAKMLYRYGEERRKQTTAPPTATQ